MKGKLIFFGAVIAAVVVGSIVYHRSRRNEELNRQSKIKDLAEVPVTLARVELRSFSAAIPFTGNLLAVNRAELRAEVSGRLTRVAVFEGDNVGRGAVLSVQDEEDLLLAVQAAEAQLSSAQAQAEQAGRDYERAVQLLEKRSITKQAAQQAETYHTAAQAGVRAADSNLGIARSRLHKAQIRSPFEGQVARCFVKAGEMLAPGQAAFNVVDNRTMEIEADLPTENLSIVSPGLRARFKVSEFGDYFEGRVAQVAPAVMQDGRTLRVRIEVPNADGLLKSGLFAEGEIISDQSLEKPALPSNILTVVGRNADVFVAENNIARQRRVAVGNDQGGWRPIEREGLKPGEMVVAEGRELVSEGARLSVVNAPETSQEQVM